MSSARLVRSTKSRLFIYICGVFAFGIVVYLFHGSQLQLDDNRKALAACNQQTESLSAQLQVIFEYKLRLEKSLQKEKTEHKQTKEECQSRAKQEKEERERDLVEAANKYSALQQSTKLLQSKQKDLEDDNNNLRQKNLKLLEDLELQKKQYNAKLNEEQQLRASKEKAIENLKTRNLELEVKYNKLLDEFDQMKKDKSPDWNRISTLEKAKVQLERELEAAKSQLENCQGGEKRVSVPGDNQSGVEPSKLMSVNKVGNNSTTPVINPEAVIDHDGSSPKPSLSKSTKSVSAVGESSKKPTQAVAAPIQQPMKQVDADAEMNRQIPMPQNLAAPQPQSPENTVIKRPESHREDDNNGGEVGNIAGPLNPIQEQAAPPLQGESRGVAALETARNKAMNAIPWEDDGPQNLRDGAHEEGEEEAPLPHNQWRVGDEGNKVLPNHMNHDYREEYERDQNQEEGLGNPVLKPKPTKLTPLGLEVLN
ncbi:Golgi integral membrane protein 4-like isoform X2 [Macrosteles quadrilineatus]|uniref:Golgi integral membrane protein 4-like isoform X2 n=1 Tax=Macrosteles quadrilineatus TaxID=74068 RepID=UPI0023E22BAE|nr:Golgi integral membrane protein 4-like isoform X2 [Macrosteles quadrilineatus]